MSAWLIDTLLYTGTLIALVLVLRRPVGRFFGPQIAYALWALPFLQTS
jgi:beta-lactamase regulating signal transducer with metallopeptidase domain